MTARKLACLVPVSNELISFTDIYLGALAMMNSGTVELFDNAKLFKQLIGLEWKTSRGGRKGIAQIIMSMLIGCGH